MTPKTFLDNHSIRGMRNNNPGNLIRTAANWVGKLWDNRDTKFERFTNMRYGLRALFINLRTGYGNGVNTVEKIITKYAPASDGNDTKAYINSVAKALGVNPTAKLSLTKTVHIGLVKAIVKTEVGGTAFNQFTDADFADGYEAMGHKTVVKTALSALTTIAIAFVVFFYSVVCLTM